MSKEKSLLNELAFHYSTLNTEGIFQMHYRAKSSINQIKGLQKIVFYGMTNDDKVTIDDPELVKLFLKQLAIDKFKPIASKRSKIYTIANAKPELFIKLKEEGITYEEIFERLKKVDKTELHSLAAFSRTIQRALKDATQHPTK